MPRVHVVISGEVQGVGYRYSLQMVADRAGVTGWVRNRRDGTVEAELEGPASAVDDVLTWAHRGPPAASVTGVDATTVDATGAQVFEVRATA